MDFRFSRIAIINRGEPAMRLIRAVRDLNAELGTPLRTIALVTDADRDSLFAREADEVVSIGSALFVDPRDGARKSRYLDYATLKSALITARAEAAWVGWGFVAEHPEFADLCQTLGIVFVGPSGEVMRKLGDKIASKRIAESADFPVTPWSNGPVESVEEAIAHARRIGFPCMLKATAGGGGRGIRKVTDESGLASAFESAHSEALKAFGDGTLFLERMVSAARHVEVQVVCDRFGNGWALGLRDCTIQRRNQKVVEEAPSPVLTSETEKQIRAAAVRLALQAGYVNAGTVECLFEPSTSEFFFMEMNTRLQVEHPVTELTTGVDIVKLQLRMANGERLDGPCPPTVGHAIEVRLNAEDPDNGFTPSPGRVDLARFPSGPGIRVDTGIAQGDVIPSEFDSMVAKIIAVGSNRAEALGRLRRALEECAVVVREGTTNAGFLRRLLAHPQVVSSQVDTGWLDRMMASPEGLATTLPHAELALFVAAIDEAMAEHQAEIRSFVAASERGRPKTRTDFGITLSLRTTTGAFSIRVEQVGLETFRVTCCDKTYQMRRTQSDPYTGTLEVDGRRHRVVTSLQGITRLVTIDGVGHRISRDSGGMVRSPAAAIVLAVTAKPGDRVQVGDRLLTLEAMKMEAAVTAPEEGIVQEILVSPNQQVAPGTPLVLLEPQSGRGDAPTVQDLSCSLAPLNFQLATLSEALSETQALLLGFEIDPGRLDNFLKKGLPPGNHLREVQSLLETFTDLVALHEHAESSHTDHPSGEPMRYFMRTLDAKPLGTQFTTRLSKHLARYGVTELSRSRKLEEALMLVHRAHQRLERALPMILKILELQLEHDTDTVRRTQPGMPSASLPRELLDALIVATQSSYPSVNNLAKNIRHSVFERTHHDGIQARVYASLTQLLQRASAEHHHCEETIREIAECPYPLLGFLLPQLADPRTAALGLEILLHHYYRERQFEQREPILLGNHHALVASFPLRDKTMRVILAALPSAAIHNAGILLADFLGKFPDSADTIVDLFLTDAPAEEYPELARVVAGEIDGKASRLSLVGFRPDGTTDAITLRPEPPLWQEDELTRGLHPVEAKRFELWRMAEFQVTRKPTKREDVSLFHLVSKANPRDERLLAFAEVRDLTPVRNELGRMVELPHFERQFREAAACLREELLRSPPKREPAWNRIIINVAPPLMGQEREFLLLAHKLQPYVEGLHLEKVVIKARIFDKRKGQAREQVIEISNADQSGLKVVFLPPRSGALAPLSEYERRVVQMRSRKQMYAYEIVKMLTPSRTGEVSEFPAGEFVELDLPQEGVTALEPVERPLGQNRCNVVVGLIRNFTPRHPEGMERVVILGDGSRDMGALAEPECRRIIAALNLAERRSLPVEWFPVSSGARISMDSGTENLDWTAAVLKRIIETTEAGLEINILVNGINVGAQAYWNAEATMLMHTRGILVMTPEGSMVLTGKRALDYSGGVSAEDNQGIGGFERVMGPNGQAQYFARDLRDACRILFSHYDFTYRHPGEPVVRRARTIDLPSRQAGLSPHPEAPFQTVGEIFADATNPGRKKPFDMRSVLGAVVDSDLPHLERWKTMRHAETAIVWDAWLGGISACVIGVESKAQPRTGYVPGDGPDSWAGGTLFPHSSKKVARAINSASGNRPVVVVANLSGFDGSPESLRHLQLEYGAEIGRAVVKCKSPIVFCVITRFHGGAYVVFSKALNEKLQVAALRGAFASVIGGTPAAAVVFPNEVRDRAHADPRIREINRQISAAEGRQKAVLYSSLNTLFQKVYLEKQAEVATEFDAIHSVERALKMGSLDSIVSPEELRAYLIDALEKGLAQEGFSGGNRTDTQLGQSSHR